MADLRTGLRELSLQGVEETGREIGRGSYGVVQEYLYKGLRCAGKVIHDSFINTESEQNAVIVKKFEDECIFLSKQRHPNIVLFLGVYFKGNAIYPALLMELLPTSLNNALTEYKNMPAHIKNVILYDIACGLNFLHDREEPLVHRDLSSNNVLLSENFHAKIADLGVARIISGAIVSEGNHMQLTNVPGTPAFMPPETFYDHPDYDKSLDMFSYGNLILNTINQKWPKPVGTFTKDNMKKKEVDRRKVDLDEMGETHPLREFTIRCLEDDRALRPSALGAVKKLFQEIQARPPPFTNAMQMMHCITKLTGEAEDLDTRVKAITEENEKLKSIESAKDSLEMEVTNLKEEASALRKCLDDKEAEVHRKENTVERLKNDITTIKQRTGNKMILMEPTASLQWNSCASLPCQRKHLQAVEFQEKIYVGSGYGKSDEISRQIYCYDPSTDEWKDCPASITLNFAMTVFDKQLLLIGGKENDALSKQVQHLTANRTEWEFCKSEDMPEMRHARAGAVAASTAFSLIVAGGYNDSRNRVNTVEVYDRRVKMWFEAPELPRACAELKTAVVHGDQWYLLGGANQYKQVFTTSLPKFVDISVKLHMPDQVANGASEHNDSSLSEPWTTLVEVPFEFSSIANFGGSLIALGGEKGSVFGSSYFSQIHVYNNSKSVWMCVADMEVELSKATAIAHSNGELFIIGGRNKTGNELQSMHKCKLICSKSCMEQN